MFIRVLVLIGSRRKAVRLFTHFYPSGLDMPLVNLAQSIRSCSCPCSWRNSVLSSPKPFSTRSRAPGHGSLCFPLTAQPQKKPFWAAVASCGVLSGRGDWPACQPAAPQPADATPASQRTEGYLTEYIGKGRHVGGEGCRCRWCSGVTCGAKTTKICRGAPEGSSPPPRLPSPPLASPHKYPSSDFDTDPIPTTCTKRAFSSAQTHTFL
jgi:hypothetical protein